MQAPEHRHPINVFSCSNGSQYPIGKYQVWIDSVLDQQCAGFDQARNRSADTVSRDPAEHSDVTRGARVVDQVHRLRLQAARQPTPVYLEQKHQQLEITNHSWIERRPQIPSSDQLQHSIGGRRGQRCAYPKVSYWVRP